MRHQTEWAENEFRQLRTRAQDSSGDKDTASNVRNTGRVVPHVKIMLAYYAECLLLTYLLSYVLMMML